MTTVIDAGDLRKYRTEIPNIVDDMGLSVYAFRLYVHLKRVAGDSGRCFQGRRKMAEVCGMSPAMVTNAKRELVERGLIQIAEAGRAETNTADTIVIVDVWRENFAAFAKSQPGHVVTSPGHDMTSPGQAVTTPGHVVEPKKEPIKKEPIKKEPGKKSAQPAAPDPIVTHPAVAAYRDTFKLSLSKAQAAMVIEAAVDLEDWVRAMRAWLGRGYSPKNITGMLEWARNPNLAERQNGNGKARPISKVAGSMAAVDEIEAMLREGKL